MKTASRSNSWTAFPELQPDKNGVFYALMSKVISYLQEGRGRKVNE
jgi:hypothetical protein